MRAHLSNLALEFSTGRDGDGDNVYDISYIVSFFFFLFQVFTLFSVYRNLLSIKLAFWGIR